MNKDNAKNWTLISKMCLERQCICKGCYYDEFFKTSYTKIKCQCKYSVLKLIEKYGTPKGYKGPSTQNKGVQMTEDEYYNNCEPKETKWGDLNCDECDNKECEHWKERYEDKHGFKYNEV